MWLNSNRAWGSMRVDIVKSHGRLHLIERLTALYCIETRSPKLFGKRSVYRSMQVSAAKPLCKLVVCKIDVEDHRTLSKPDPKSITTSRSSSLQIHLAILSLS